MKSIVRWAVSNSPAMNVIMLAVLIVGGIGTYRLRREVFPEFTLETIQVSVPYPGATPFDVEEGICQKIEEAIRSVDGIKKITSVASEGMGSVSLELNADVKDPQRVLNEVRSEVDQIPSFPELSEQPEVRQLSIRQPAIRIGVIASNVSGPDAAVRLREVAERVREDLLRLKQVSQVSFVGAPPYQIDVELPEDTLRSYGLSLQDVAQIIRRENHQLPGGTIRADSQEVLVRGDNRRLTGKEIARLPLVSQASGAVLTVGDLGVVRDEFEDVAFTSRINGQPGLALSVERTSSEDLLAMTEAVRQYVLNIDLPPGYELTTWGDQSIEVRGRLELLLKNGAQGLLLVFLMLALFLEIRLAFWVALGIPIAILSTGAFLLFTGQTLNMLSMFAFIMAIGILVDDAIVVSENVFAHRQMGKSYQQAAIDGASEVVPSITASVATTIVAFMPLLFVVGTMGKFIGVLPIAVISMLFVSLLESMTILPCHLSHHDSFIFRVMSHVFFVFRWLVHVVTFLNRQTNRMLTVFVDRIYEPSIRMAIANRLVVMSGFIAMLIVAIGFVRSGITPFIIFPKQDANSISASLAFPDGTPAHVTERCTREIEDAFWRVNDRLTARSLVSPRPRVAGQSPAASLEETRLHEDSLAVTSFRVVGQQVSGGFGGGATTGSQVGSVEVELRDVTQRSVSSEEIVAAWRDEVGPIAGTVTLSFSAQNRGPGGVPIEFKLLVDKESVNQLQGAVEEAMREVAEFPGVYDVTNDSPLGKWEYRLRVKEEAIAMGVRPADLAETVRATYFGEEVMRIQRGRHEVKLMVRYPRNERSQLANFNEIRVRTDDGIERPLTELAEVDVVRGYSKINRLDQQRAITISANIDEAVGNARSVVQSLQRTFMRELLQRYPDVRVLWEGQQEQTQESVRSLFTGFGVALLAMFVLLSFQFKSYFQPFLILLIIPFGVIGAIAGHAIIGLPLTLFSLFGMVALTGVVVNDSIVLVDFINARVRAGMPVRDALAEAGSRRFRPVLLTTVTTVVGLTPILLETSAQAQLLIPMATSIAFGEILGTLLVLYLVPVFYSLHADAVVFFAR